MCSRLLSVGSLPTPRHGVTDLGERRTTSEQAGPISDRSVVPWNLRLALGAEVNAASPLFLLFWHQRPPLSGRVGSAVRARLRQHGLFGVDRRGDLHARPRRRQLSVFGALADRRYQSRPDSLVRLYGVLEAPDRRPRAALVSLVLPHLGGIVARLSSYETDSDGVAGAHIRVTPGSRCHRRRAAGTYDGADGWDVDGAGSRGRAIGPAVVGLARRRCSTASIPPALRPARF